MMSTSEKTHVIELEQRIEDLEQLLEDSEMTCAEAAAAMRYTLASIELKDQQHLSLALDRMREAIRKCGYGAMK